MTLPGMEPEFIEKRLKLYMYGAPGSGKTRAAIQFPKPFIIDTERGCENKNYIAAIKDVGGRIYQTSDCDDVINAVLSLMREKHNYKTLVIDTMTVVHDNLIEKEIKIFEKKRKDNKDVDMRAVYGNRTRKMQHLMNLLLRLDMNIILTSHVKDGNEGGIAIDGFKGLERLFDLVLEIRKPTAGKIRKAFVAKTRLEEEFPENTLFDFSYDEIISRYGSDQINKDVKIDTLASDEQVKELDTLINSCRVSVETVAKWLVKSRSESLSEMPADIIQKCIDSLRGKVNE